MSSAKASLPHEDRTAAEPREDDVHTVILDDIQRVNDSIKLYKLRVKDKHRGIKFSPGQWLDLFVPSLPKAGGFTLTSTPSQALPPHPTLELAIQKSPNNPPAAWLWQHPKSILGAELKVRVGGSFTWPPFGWSGEQVRGIDRVVFVAGGVGINPLISMLSAMHTSSAPVPPQIHFLYTTKPPLTEDKSNIIPSSILFLSRLLDIAAQRPDQIHLTTFITGHYNKIQDPQALDWFHDRRIAEADLLGSLGGDVEGRSGTVVYVCGPQGMTDEMVGWFQGQEGVRRENVFCEKWW